MGAGRRRRRSLTGSTPVCDGDELLATKRPLAAGGKLTQLSSFPQERADFLTNSLHIAPMRAMSATAV